MALTIEQLQPAIDWLEAIIRKDFSLGMVGVTKYTIAMNAGREILEILGDKTEVRKQLVTLTVKVAKEFGRTIPDNEIAMMMEH